jgi:hypothetical protein
LAVCGSAYRTKGRKINKNWEGERRGSPRMRFEFINMGDKRSTLARVLVIERKK